MSVKYHVIGHVEEVDVVEDIRKDLSVYEELGVFDSELDAINYLVQRKKKESSE